MLLTVYLVRDLHRPAWLSGVLFSLSTALVTCQTAVSRAAGRLRPVTVLRLAAGGWAVSFLLLWVLQAVPAAAVVPGAVTAIVTFTAAEMLQGPVLNALAAACSGSALLLRDRCTPATAGPRPRPGEQSPQGSDLVGHSMTYLATRWQMSRYLATHR